MYIQTKEAGRKGENQIISGQFSRGTNREIWTRLPHFQPLCFLFLSHPQRDGKERKATRNLAQPFRCFSVSVEGLKTEDNWPLSAPIPARLSWGRGAGEA